MRNATRDGSKNEYELFLKHLQYQFGPLDNLYGVDILI